MTVEKEKPNLYPHQIEAIKKISEKEWQETELTTYKVGGDIIEGTTAEEGEEKEIYKYLVECFQKDFLKKEIQDQDRKELVAEFGQADFKFPTNIIFRNVTVEQVIQNWPTELRKALILSNKVDVAIVRNANNMYIVHVATFRKGYFSKA